MLYRHSIENCLDTGIGTGGLARELFKRELAATRPAIETLRVAAKDGGMPFLRLPRERGDLAAIKEVAERYRRNFREVIVLGTGGSSLGGQTLVALADMGFGPRPGAPRVRFLENIDPDSFDAFFAATDPRACGFLMISKSGTTAETMTQFLLCLKRWAAMLPGLSAGKHFTVVTGPADSPLRRLAGRFGIPLLDHDPELGGRYSVLSVTGILPAWIAGLDPLGFRTGAAAVLDAALGASGPADCEPAKGAALSVGLLKNHSITQTVIMPYLDRLAPFGLWFRQLWAESLGKDGTGTTPIRALGTVDQHSQLQLYLDGPADKMFTLICKDSAGAGERIDPDLAADPGLAWLAGKTMGDLLEAEQQATAATLAGRGRPVRIFRIERLDERVLGALLMHFMLETAIAAQLLGVDAFDQPAVEAGKLLARETMARGQPPGEA
jgi:glucose-6-phosphate isomerase